MQYQYFFLFFSLFYLFFVHFLTNVTERRGNGFWVSGGLSGELEGPASGQCTGNRTRSRQGQEGLSRPRRKGYKVYIIKFSEQLVKVQKKRRDKLLREEKKEKSSRPSGERVFEIG